MDQLGKSAAAALAALVVLTFAWNAFSANLMEQFVRFDSPVNVLGAVLRWASLAGVICVPVALLYGRDDFAAAAGWIVLPATLSALTLTGPYFRLHEPTAVETAAYWTSQLTMIAGCAALLIGRRRPVAARAAVKAFLWCAAGCAPLNLLMQIPALMRPAALAFVTFGVWHIAAILLFPLAAVAMYFGLRAKSPTARVVFLFGVSMSLLYQLLARFSFVRLHDYQNLSGIVSVLPFYMCSFAMAVMPVAVATGSRALQTALFLMNTPGALIAIVYPANPVVTSIFHYNITYFVVSHAVLFALATQLAFSLDARPDPRQLGRAAVLLAVYFAAVLLVDNAVSAVAGADPNFSYVAQCPLPIPLEKIGALEWGWFRFSPLYLVVLYLTHLAMCAATCAVYRMCGGAARRRICEAAGPPAATEAAAAVAGRDGSRGGGRRP